MLLKDQIDDASLCFEQALEMVVTQYGDLADECADVRRATGICIPPSNLHSNGLLWAVAFATRDVEIVFPAPHPRTSKPTSSRQPPPHPTRLPSHHTHTATAAAAAATSIQAYRYYGTSLLQIAKRESSLLGTDASRGSAAPAAPDADAAAASASASASGPAEEEEEEEEQDDDEPSTEQLAWETLECARIILKRSVAVAEWWWQWWQWWRWSQALAVVEEDVAAVVVVVVVVVVLVVAAMCWFVGTRVATCAGLACGGPAREFSRARTPGPFPW